VVIGAPARISPSSKIRSELEKVAMDEIPIDLDMPTIPEFFKGRSIFVTGATGFMGKVKYLDESVVFSRTRQHSAELRAFRNQGCSKAR
jgi:hypothetical protein